jgi:hypothetical protein
MQVPAKKTKTITIFASLLAFAFVAPGFLALALAQATGAPATIRRINVLNQGGNFELEIDASAPFVPQTQVITGPDRLIVDFPGALPGPGLRPVIVSIGAVKGVRMGLFQSSPPITRLVVDLKSPQPYQVFPSGRTVIVKIMQHDAHAAIAPLQPTVAANVPPPPVATSPPPPKLQVDFIRGRLRIWANRASLAEVLREVQRVIGANVTIPAGAEQDQVTTDIGPAAPREVITTLLSGSPYNIILLGSGGDSSKLTAIILTARGPGVDMPVNYTPASVADANSEPQPEPPPPVQDIPPEPPPQQPDAQQPPQQ